MHRPLILSVTLLAASGCQSAAPAPSPAPAPIVEAPAPAPAGCELRYQEDLVPRVQFQVQAVMSSSYAGDVSEISTTRVISGAQGRALMERHNLTTRFEHPLDDYLGRLLAQPCAKVVYTTFKLDDPRLPEGILYIMFPQSETFELPPEDMRDAPGVMFRLGVDDKPPADPDASSTLTPARFEQLMAAGEPLVVAFYMKTCGSTPGFLADLLATRPEGGAKVVYDPDSAVVGAALRATLGRATPSSGLAYFEGGALVDLHVPHAHDDKLKRQEHFFARVSASHEVMPPPVKIFAPTMKAAQRVRVLSILKHWSGADLSHQPLRGARLEHATLTGLTLAGADLRDANLSHAWLAHVSLLGANLEGANLEGARFLRVICPDGTRSEAQGDRCPELAFDAPLSAAVTPR